MSDNSLNRYIKVVDEEVLRITKSFAEKNLSKNCLNCSDYNNNQYYEWELGNSAYSVMFELPMIFNVKMQEVFSLLSFYCPEYINEAGIDSNNFMDIFESNCNKEIILRDKTAKNSNAQYGSSGKKIYAVSNSFS